VTEHPRERDRWEKARDRDRAHEAKQAAPADPAATRQRSARQDALAAFVEQHELSCFKCGADKAEWAKTGISKKRGAWAIYAHCVAEPS
jgi:hypothetical protein